MKFTYLFLSLALIFNAFGQENQKKLDKQAEKAAKAERIAKATAAAEAATNNPAKVISVVELEDAPKVLFVTHEPGTWHDYSAQRKIFESIAKKQKWHTDVMTAGYEGLLKELASNPDFASGYDVVVYNICVANTKNMMAAYNIIKQTEDKGVNSLLIHGALHSFFASFTERALKGTDGKRVSVGDYKGVAHPSVLTGWKEEHPDKEFPVWGDYTGLASQKHTKKEPIKVKKNLTDHEAVQGVAEEYVTGLSELYVPYYKVEGLQEILMGTISKKQKAPILWESPVGKGKVMGFTLGHFTEEWNDPNFESVLVGSIQYLTEEE